MGLCAAHRGAGQQEMRERGGSMSGYNEKRKKKGEPEKMLASTTAPASRAAAGPAGPSHRAGMSPFRPLTRTRKALAAPPPAQPAPLPVAGPPTPPPDYAALDARPLSILITALFRARMVASLGGGGGGGVPQEEGYAGIIALTRALLARPPGATRAATRAILRSLFPPGLPWAFARLFARPFPLFSARLNAAATAVACEWLMGEVEVNDGGEAARAAGTAAPGVGVLVKRCRYLEATGPCASACLNACRRPTQDFFSEDMGLPLTMTPNFETFECQFSWGVAPAADERDDAFLAGSGGVACFSTCPLGGEGGGRAGGTACPGLALQAGPADFCGGKAA
jgi:hypothetical protein